MGNRGAVAAGTLWARTLLGLAMLIGLAGCGSDVARHGGVRDDDPRSGHVGERVHGEDPILRFNYESNH